MMATRSLINGWGSYFPVSVTMKPGEVDDFDLWLFA